MQQNLIVPRKTNELTLNPIMMARNRAAELKATVLRMQELEAKLRGDAWEVQRGGDV